MENTNTITLEEFKEQCTNITMEAFSLNVNLSKVRQAIPDLLISLKSILSSTGKEATVNFGDISYHEYVKHFNNTNYMANRNRKIMQPRGLNVTFDGYLLAIQNVQDTVDRIVSETLKPFEQYLAMIIVSPDSAKSQQEAKQAANIGKHDIDKCKRQLTECFGKDTTELRPYSALVNRNADWALIAERYSDVAKRLKEIDRTKIQEYVKTIAEHCDRLVKMFEEDGSKNSASAITIANIANLAYATAQEVELFSIQCYAMENMYACLEYARKNVR